MILDLVKQVIENDRPKTEIELILRIWELQGLKLTDEQRIRIRNHCVAPSTIGRARRKLIQKGLLFGESRIESLI